MREAEASLALVQAGFASEVEVIRRRGARPDDVLEQIATWRKKVAGKGLTLNSDAANDKQAAGPMPANGA